MINSVDSVDSKHDCVLSNSGLAYPMHTSKIGYRYPLSIRNSTPHMDDIYLLGVKFGTNQ